MILECIPVNILSWVECDSKIHNTLQLKYRRMDSYKLRHGCYHQQTPHPEGKQTILRLDAKLSPRVLVVDDLTKKTLVMVEVTET